MVEHLSKTQRGRILQVALLVIFMIMAGKLVHLQVFSYDYYFQVSEENRIRVIPKPALRGRIVDREGRVLALDRPSYTVSIIPSEATNVARLANDLSPLLNMSEESIAQRVRERRFRRYEPVPIRRDLDFPAVCVIEESNELFPGVIYQLSHARTYPYGSVGAHFLGYTSEVDEKEARSQYRMGALIGRAGIEKQYDNKLRGFDGVDYLEVAATGRILGQLEGRPGKDPTPGEELGLTIDLDLQLLADSLFGDTLSGAAVFIDPRNGEILALVSKPSYDANTFGGFVSREDYLRLSNDPRRPLFDRTIRGTYPPGSTTKTLTAGAALELGIIQPSTHFKPCYGGYQFGTRFFRCHKRTGHGDLDLYGAIEMSCDTYFYQLGLKLGLANFSQYARACGFPNLTGIDLPAEKAGHVPDEAWYNRVYGKQGWTRAVLLNLAIGQGEFLSTPLELALFYCGLANDGEVMKPRLARYFRPVRGDTSWTQPEVLRKLPFSRETIDVLKEGCRRVVHGARGTAVRSRINGVEMGGKTGTSQNPHGNEHALFVAFAPYDEPEIVGCVIAENAGHGSVAAAPMVKQVFTRYFQKRGVLAPPPTPIRDVAHYEVSE